MKQRMKFSVILPVCHGGVFLEKALNSLGQIDFPINRFEVIVVAGKGYDESEISVKSVLTKTGLNIRYMNCSESRRSEHLNIACRAAKGLVLVFADDDCIFRKDWLNKISNVLENERNIGIIGGKDELLSNGSAFDMALDSVLNSYFGTGGLRKPSGVRIGPYYPKLWNMAVPREVAFDVAIKTRRGLPQIFDETLCVHEDVDFGHRVQKSGKRIIFSPQICVDHYRDTTYRSFLMRNFYMGSVSRVRGIHRFPHVALTTFAIGMPALVIASFFSDTTRILFLFVTAIYGTVLLISAIGGFNRCRRFKVSAIIPGLLVTLHLARGFGYLFPRHDEKLKEKTS